MATFERRNLIHPWRARVHLATGTLHLGSYSTWADAVRKEEEARKAFGIRPLTRKVKTNGQR